MSTSTFHGQFLTNLEKNGWNINESMSEFNDLQGQELTQLLSVYEYLLNLSQYLTYSKKELESVRHQLLDEDIFVLLRSAMLLQTSADSPLLTHLINLLTQRLSLSLSETAAATFRQSLKRVLYYLKTPELLLSIGGDDRLTLQIEAAHPEGQKVNKYLSTTFPRDEVIRRGSCTCTTLNQQNYALVQEKYWEFLSQLLRLSLQSHRNPNEAETITNYFETISQGLHARIRRVIGLDSNPALLNERNLHVKRPQVVLFPSGSDAEFLPLIVGLIRSSALFYAKQALSAPSAALKVYNYVIAAGEVGSGTPQAASGQHFSPLTPRGAAAQPPQTAGQPLAGMDSSLVELVQFKPRSAAGDVSFQEEKIVTSALAHLRGNAAAVVVLHVVCGSKTGLIYPSRESLAYLFSQLPSQDAQRVIVVIDACQLRCRLDIFAEEYLAKNFLILFTGSKFFTAPPFCGGVLVPTNIANELEDYLHQRQLDFPFAVRAGEEAAGSRERILIPPGIVEYLTQYELSGEFVYFKKYLQQLNALTIVPEAATSPSSTATNLAEEPGWFNFGLHLRWTVGVDAMERYSAIPSSLLKEFTRLWVETTTNQVAALSPFVQLLSDKINGIDQENFLSLNSIVSFSLFTREAQADHPQQLVLRELTADEYKEFHKLMTLSQEDALPGVRAMLGQPVKLSDDNKHVLRIALGADVVIRCLEEVAKQQEAADRPSEQRLITWLREAFQLIGRLSFQDLTVRGKALTGVGEYRLNPFLPFLREILLEDRKVIQKIFRLVVQWKSIFPVASLVEAQGNPLVTVAYREKILELHATDLQLYRPQFPFPAGKTRPVAAVGPVGVIDLPTVQEVLLALQQKKLLSSSSKAFQLYDLDAVVSSFHSVKERFSTLNSPHTSFLHCFAVKSAPIRYLLHLAVREGLGLECASLTEVKMALSSGCRADRIVYDSPCKTYEELSFALRHGVRINGNSFEDLNKIGMILDDLLTQEGFVSSSEIGLRVNPLIGAGTIAALSTATGESKFGVPLFSSATKLFPSDEELVAAAQSAAKKQAIFQSFDAMRENDAVFRAIVEAYERSPFLRGMMCHVGSQGMAVSLMVEGVLRLTWLVDYLEYRFALTTSATQSPRRLHWLDIGGGLSSNYSSNEIRPTFAEYAREIERKCPQLYARPESFLILTEFGKALIAKTAVVVSKIEDVLAHPVQVQGEPVVSCITHVGADMFLRNAYAPDQFAVHRMHLLDGSHRFLLPAEGLTADDEFSFAEKEQLATATRPAVVRANIVGPLCFSGDTLAKHLRLPEPRVGDAIVLMDCGANTLSLFSRHCSRQSPVVIGFRRLSYRLKAKKAGQADEERSEFLFAVIRQQETAEEVMAFWE
jgi:diaminopimelate decarboxylase